MLLAPGPEEHAGAGVLGAARGARSIRWQLGRATGLPLRARGVQHPRGGLQAQRFRPSCRLHCTPARGSDASALSQGAANCKHLKDWCQCWQRAAPGRGPCGWRRCSVVCAQWRQWCVRRVVTGDDWRGVAAWVPCSARGGVLWVALVSAMLSIADLRV